MLKNLTDDTIAISDVNKELIMYVYPNTVSKRAGLERYPSFRVQTKTLNNVYTLLIQLKLELGG